MTAAQPWELRPTPVQGRCGTCDWPTDSLPCPYCAAVTRQARAAALADALTADDQPVQP